MVVVVIVVVHDYEDDHDHDHDYEGSSSSVERQSIVSSPAVTSIEIEISHRPDFYHAVRCNLVYHESEIAIFDMK